MRSPTGSASAGLRRGTRRSAGCGGRARGAHRSGSTTASLRRGDAAAAAGRGANRSTRAPPGPPSVRRWSRCARTGVDCGVDESGRGETGTTASRSGRAPTRSGPAARAARTTSAPPSPAVAVIVPWMGRPLGSGASSRRLEIDDDPVDSYRHPPSGWPTARAAAARWCGRCRSRRRRRAGRAAPRRGAQRRAEHPDFGQRTSPRSVACADGHRTPA